MLELLKREYSLLQIPGAAGSVDGQTVWCAVKVMSKYKTVVEETYFMRTDAQSVRLGMRKMTPNYQEQEREYMLVNLHAACMKGPKSMKQIELVNWKKVTKLSIQV